MSAALITDKELKLLEQAAVDSVWRDTRKALHNALLEIARLRTLSQRQAEQIKNLLADAEAADDSIDELETMVSDLEEEIAELYACLDDGAQ